MDSGLRWNDDGYLIYYALLIAIDAKTDQRKREHIQPG